MTNSVLPAADFTGTDRYANLYKDLPFEPIQASFRKRKIFEILDRLRPQSVLEVGCGLQSIGCLWKYSAELFVVEPHIDFANKARTDLPDAKIIQDAIESSPPTLEKKKFDVVLLSSLLHEVYQPSKILEAVAKYCHSETTVHINVPNAVSMHRLLAKAMGLVESVFEISETQTALGQKETYDLHKLQKLVQNCGFEVIESGSIFIKPFTHQQMQQLCTSGFCSEQMLEGFYKLAETLPEFGSEIFTNARLARSH